MNNKILYATLIALGLLSAAPAFAQTSVPDDGTGIIFARAEMESEPTGSSAGVSENSLCESETLVLSCYGIAEFEDPKDMYGRLTETGRCPEHKMAGEAEPCAFIYYERISGSGKTVQLKPVFKIESKGSVLTMHGGKFMEISVEKLYFDEVTVKDANTGKESTAKYRSFGVVGNAENRTNCASNRPCLSRLIKEDMFSAYKRVIPDFVVQKLWNNRRVDRSVRVVQGQ